MGNGRVFSSFSRCIWLSVCAKSRGRALASTISTEICDGHLPPQSLIHLTPQPFAQPSPLLCPMQVSHPAFPSPLFPCSHTILTLVQAGDRTGRPRDLLPHSATVPSIHASFRSFRKRRIALRRFSSVAAVVDERGAGTASCMYRVHWKGRVSSGLSWELLADLRDVPDFEDRLAEYRVANGAAVRPHG